MRFTFHDRCASRISDIYCSRFGKKNTDQRIRLSNETPFTPTYVKSNLTRTSDPSQIYSNRVQGRQILLDTPERESRARKERISRRNEELTSRRKAGVIRKQEVKQKGLWKLSKAETKFDNFLPLHFLWLDYMSELLNLTPPPSPPETHGGGGVSSNASNIHTKLVKADFHGSILTVRQSKNPCLVGLSGIVVHETENAFKIVTQKDSLKLVPKPHSIFVLFLPLYASTTSKHVMEPTTAPSIDTADNAPSSSENGRKYVLDLPHMELELYGNQFCFRSSDRASKKFKSKETIEL
ncbi:hypothetical protein NLI96_g8000 [Meripilus lineatus]|uniref:Uncharacterized protein n=1 Tax=Meripilus lineatus TaxID=2056292 RepID=A0AAD5UY50_9APHY|nr:hypothetical protein NLI96_g8000 [Physisporinus lineatus]